MKRLIIAGISCSLLVTAVRGQEPQFRQQERLESSPLPPFQAPEKLTLAPRDQELGVQQLLLRVPPPPWLELSSTTDLLFVDNVYLTTNNRRSDSLFVETLQAVITPPWIRQPFKLTAAGGHQWFLYGDETGLDFDANYASVLMSYQIVRDLSIAASYHAAWLDSQTSGFQFYRDGDARVDLRWSRRMSQELTVMVGLSYDYHTTSPAIYDRSDYGIYCGSRYAFLRQLAGELFFRYQFEDFAHGSRQDSSVLVGGALVYTQCRYASVRAIVSHYGNDSNESTRDYQVLNAGGGLVLVVRF